FSLMRLKNLKGNPSFLLANVASISAPSSSTVRLVLKQPDPSIMFILPNPSLSILDSKVVIAQGGSDAANADKVDKAEAYLSTPPPASGPYTVTAFSPGTSVSLTTNPHYWGPAPLIKNLLLLNQTPPTAKLTLEKGDTDIATALAPTQVA